jgi:hypothetical protein
MVASSDQLGLADDNNRVLVYGSNGGQIGTLLGSRPEVSRTANLLTTRGQNGELTLYDLQTLQPPTVNNFDSRVAFSTFSAEASACWSSLPTRPSTCSTPPRTNRALEEDGPSTALATPMLECACP